MNAPRADLGAFVAHAPLGSLSLGRGEGPLAGATLGVKDLFDVAGLRTGAGSPAWFAEAEPATRTAPAVERLIEAGARVVGKTITDELAWSLNGENVHYGAPENPRAPGRIPGGSSAGSASATAGGLVDIGLGTDTGGSVRLPASYCGLWGFRPTHGRIPLDGVTPLAPSYDTVGWFTRDAALLAKVGAALIGPPETPGFRRVLLAEDAFLSLRPEHRPALAAAARALADRIGAPVTTTLAEEGLDAWRLAFRTLQSAEVWATHGAWVRRAEPSFGPGIRERFEAAARIGADEVAAADAVRAKVRRALEARLSDDAVIVVPGAPCPPPPRGLSGAELEDVRDRALDILCPAGHAGLPQLALPALDTAEGPLGLGIIGPRCSDERLLGLAERLAADGGDARR